MEVNNFEIVTSKEREHREGAMIDLVDILVSKTFISLHHLLLWRNSVVFKILSCLADLISMIAHPHPYPDIIGFSHCVRFATKCHILL